MKKAIAALALGTVMLMACSTPKTSTQSAANKKYSLSMSQTPWYQPDWNRDLLEGYDYMEVVFSDENGTNNKLLKYHRNDSLALMNKPVFKTEVQANWKTSTPPSLLAVTPQGHVEAYNFGSVFPSPVSQTGKVLKSNGSTFLWMNVLDNGSWTGSGTIGQTTYTITHGLGYTPSSVFIQAQSTAAAEKSYVTNITATTFQIVFLTIPLLGTNNINLRWYAIR